MCVEKKVPEIRFKGFSGEWEEKKFKDIVANLSGGASIAPTDYQSSGMRTIPKGAVNDTGTADLSGSKCVSIDFYEKNILSKTSSGDLVTSLRDLVPTAPNMGRIVKIRAPREDFLMPQGVYKLELENGVDENFVITYSNSEKFRKIISKEKNGSTQVHIRNGEFLNIEIFKPKPKEQTQIGNTFQKLDNLINQYQQKHDKLSNIKKAMLEKMFPKQGESIPEIRFKGFSGEWLNNTIGEICGATFGGGTPSTNDKDFWQGEIPWIQSSDLKDGIVSSVTAKKCITKSAVKKSATKLISGNSIAIVTRVGVGKISLMQGEYATSQDFLSLSDLKIDSQYAVYVIWKKLQIEKEQVQGTSIKGVTKDELLGKFVSYPETEEEQASIGNYFQKLDALINQHQQQITKLTNIKQACLSKMFI